VDGRVRIAAPVCGTATIESHVRKRTTEEHCDCMFWINSRMWDLTDVGALIAPRPLLICSAEKDWIFDIQSVRLVYGKLKRLYEAMGFPENVALVETPGGHSYHERSRKTIFKWFLKHLKGVDLPLEEIGDIDEDPRSQEASEALRVFSEPPLDERVTTVHEFFVGQPEAPNVASAEELENFKGRLKEALLADTFGAFPRDARRIRAEVELEQ
ncbi:MAG: hypothetical protein JTT11_09950, partial [Candidatus Brockarchaeota archaeon]|nr:hypothetical protein [Candidatus Brockarchaeota archaeon]